MASTYLTEQQVERAVVEAQNQAQERAREFFENEMGGKDQYPCGFAWVSVSGVKGSTRLGRMLRASGFKLNSHERRLQWWNPAGMPVQNMYCLEAGAERFAKVLRDRLGLDCYVSTRLD